MRVFGPVFALESKLASRRWRVYAGRAGFVGLMLGCSWTIWSTQADLGRNGWLSLQQTLVRAGQRSVYLMTLAELITVLLVTPATTAGAICLDKTRGTLADLLTTDLAPREIVLGKLTARLGPVVGILLCGLPVSTLIILFGGVDPATVAVTTLVALAVAALAGSLTILVSTWGTRPHEVLAVVFALLAAWLLPRTVADVLTNQGGSVVSRFFQPIDPFYVTIHATNPFASGPGPSHRPAVWFALGGCGIAIVLTSLAIASVRPALLRAAGRVSRPAPPDRLARFRREVRWWPGPSLDRDPVFWREWHRSRPTAWMRAVWRSYLGSAGLASLAFGLDRVAFHLLDGDQAGGLLCGIAATFGYLLMAITAATSLAEERARGSLDVLMATPLSTRSIVLGKWLGTFRLTPSVLCWPLLVGYFLAIRAMPDIRVGAFYAMIAFGLALAALMASLGLALACWTRRLGRALGLAVAINAGLTVAALLLGGQDDLTPYYASPFFGFGLLGRMIEPDRSGRRALALDLNACLAWAMAYAGIAMVLLLAVGLTFDRAMGRASGGRSAISTGSKARV